MLSIQLDTKIVDKEEYPLVSIIVLNYNGKHLLRKCLSAIMKRTYYQDYEIILVDNNSSDGSVELV